MTLRNGWEGVGGEEAGGRKTSGKWREGEKRGESECGEDQQRDWQYAWSRGSDFRAATGKAAEQTPCAPSAASKALVLCAIVCSTACVQGGAKAHASLMRHTANISRSASRLLPELVSSSASPFYSRVLSPLTGTQNLIEHSPHNASGSRKHALRSPLCAHLCCSARRAMMYVRASLHLVEHGGATIGAALMHV